MFWLKISVVFTTNMAGNCPNISLKIPVVAKKTGLQNVPKCHKKYPVGLVDVVDPNPNP